MFVAARGSGVSSPGAHEFVGFLEGFGGDVFAGEHAADFAGTVGLGELFDLGGDGGPSFLFWRRNSDDRRSRRFGPGGSQQDDWLRF